MGLGGLITGNMGLFGKSPTSKTPKAKTVGPEYQSMLEQFIKGFPTLINAENTYKPQFTESSLANFGSAIPTFANILRGINPGQTQLLNSLTDEAQSGLDLGTELDPGLARLFQQSVRGGQAARGMGFGPSDVFDEAMGMTEFGQQLRDSRRGFASGVASLTNQFDTAPITAGALSMSAGSGPSLVNEAANYDLFNTVYNANAAKNIGDQNAKTAMLTGFNSVE